MKQVYFPYRLAAARAEIAMKHPLEQELPEIQPDIMLQQLVVKLAGLRHDQIKRTALSLTEGEVVMVAGYLPNDFYKVRLEPLFDVLKYRSSVKSCRVLWRQWQNTYDNRRCNLLLKGFLAVDRPLQAVLQDNHVTAELFEAFLSAEDIASRFGRECLALSLPTVLSYEERAAYFGVQPDTRLYQESEYLFFTYCREKDYLAVQEAELLRIVKKYDVRILKLFLVNFLDKLELKQLMVFSELLRYLMGITGPVGSGRLNHFFADLPADTKNAYIDWMNRMKISWYFGEGERSRFWEQYRAVNVTKYKKSNAVVIEFESSYAVEFLGAAMGPVYLYEKPVFETRIVQWFKWRKNAELRKLLYDNRDLCRYRKEHRGNWQYEVGGYMAANEIAERVY